MDCKELQLSDNFTKLLKELMSENEKYRTQLQLSEAWNGMTQAELSKRLSGKVQSIGLNKYLKLCALFNVPFEYFLEKV
ncbi:hypothetical protein DRO66_05130 [Candidatus Bathyarchaeota archaeon]|nr:MAG: hypothetical protein DRO66_05130 [Candidatus Bathyarchaeota archaeon]